MWLAQSLNSLYCSFWSDLKQSTHYMAKTNDVIYKTNTSSLFLTAPPYSVHSAGSLTFLDAHLDEAH